MLGWVNKIVGLIMSVVFTGRNLFILKIRSSQSPYRYVFEYDDFILCRRVRLFLP